MTASAAPGRRVPAAVRVLQVFLVGIVGAWLLLSAGLLLTFKLYRQPSASMLPAITAGDIVLVKRWAYAGRLPARGDIVVFTPPHRPDERWNKRIIGIPGDRIAFHGDGLSVNGHALRYDDLGSYHGSGAGDGQGGVRVLREWLPGRPHTVLEQPGRFHAGSQGQWQVPAQHYFVMGDNRDNSEDSRFWPHTPFVPLQNLHGKVVAVNFRPLAAGAGGNSDRLPAGTPIQ